MNGTITGTSYCGLLGEASVTVSSAGTIVDPQLVRIDRDSPGFTMHVYRIAGFPRNRWLGRISRFLLPLLVTRYTLSSSTGTERLTVMA